MKKPIPEAQASMQLTANGKLPTRRSDGQPLNVYAFRVQNPIGAYVKVGNAPSNQVYGATRIPKSVFSHEPIEPDEIILLMTGEWYVVRNNKAYSMRWSPPQDTPTQGGTSNPAVTAATLIRGGQMTFADLPQNIDYNPTYQEYFEWSPSVIEGRRIKAMDNMEKAQRFAVFMDAPRDMAETLAMLDRRDLIDDSNLRGHVAAGDPSYHDFRPYISGFMRGQATNGEGPERVVWRALRRYAYEMENGEMLVHPDVWDNPNQAAKVGLRIYKNRVFPTEDTGLRGGHKEWLDRHVRTHVADGPAIFRLRKGIKRLHRKPLT